MSISTVLQGYYCAELKYKFAVLFLISRALWQNASVFPFGERWLQARRPSASKASAKKHLPEPAEADFIGHSHTRLTMSHMSPPQPQILVLSQLSQAALVQKPLQIDA